jgi:hypothetical protein
MGLGKLKYYEITFIDIKYFYIYTNMGILFSSQTTSNPQPNGNPQTGNNSQPNGNNSQPNGNEEQTTNTGNPQTGNPQNGNPQNGGNKKYKKGKKGKAKKK